MESIEEKEWELIQLPFGEDLTAKYVIKDLTQIFVMARDSLGYRHLLIGLQTADENSSLSQPCRGIKVTKLNFTMPGRSSGIFLDLQCIDPAGHNIFNSIGGEIASELGIRGEDADPEKIVTKILSRWKNFWGFQTQNILSLEEQTGLFGELYFIKNWLFPKYGHNVVYAWEGPRGARHDFKLAEVSFEVKTSSSNKGHFHKINSLSQLADPDFGRLFLYSICVKEEHGKSMSLISIIDDCRVYLRDDIEALSAFDSLLVIAGYSEIHRADYEKRHFEVTDEKVFLVAGDFPRLTKDSLIAELPSEIENITYSLNLNTYLHKSICSGPEDFVTLEI